MAGIYIHIPFCKQACHYCDFHFSTNLKLKSDLVNAICKEITLQKDYFSGEIIETIYFGGGTPSLLTKPELSSIIEEVYKHFTISNAPEITLEANPDDLNEKHLKYFKEAGVNRLSIGIQSFNEEHLIYLNRAHNSDEAKNCVAEAKSLGFDNITIDLIYGIPSSDHSIWENDLATVMDLKIPHISAYCLTIEQQTVFGNWLKKKKIKPIDDDFAAEQFDILVKTLSKNNYEHYEVSNFAMKDHYSKHNTNYWKQQKYLGIGPGAHSFNGKSRQFNISNNPKYIKEIFNDSVPFDIEVLNAEDKINEYLLTSLRTQWGCDIEKLKSLGYDIIQEKKDFLDLLQQNNSLEIKNNTLYLTTQGKLLADAITADLFL